MAVVRIICVDSSGSTSGVTSYWNSIRDLVKKIGELNHILYWGTHCREVDDVAKIKNAGGTSPYVFLDHIVKSLNVLTDDNRGNIELHVTTDGQIYDGDIEVCVDHINTIGPYLKCVYLYYIGSKYSMNFGLNAIFGSVTQLHYSVNDVSHVHTVLTFEELQLNIDKGDIYTETFIPSLIARVRSTQAKLKQSADEVLASQLNDMRQKLIKILNDEINVRDTAVIKECYESNDGRRLEKEIKNMLFMDDESEKGKLRTRILSCFDKTAGLEMASTRRKKVRRAEVQEIAKSATNEDATTSSNVEDSITFDNIDPSTVCLLMQTAHEPIIDPSSAYVRNPVSLIKNESLCKEILKRFEMHTLSFETVLKLKGQPNRREFESAFTRANCRTFVMDPCDWPRINLNTFAISSLFKGDSGDGKFIYGNKLLWNFVVLYVLRKEIDRLGHDGDGEEVSWNRESVAESLDAALRKFYFNEKFLYSLTLHVKVALPFKNGVPLYIALWYLVRVAPWCAENSSRNVIRLPDTLPLYHVFKQYGRREAFDTDANMIAFENKLKVWTLWNTMIDRRNDPELKFIVRASYQNYIELENKIVLLSGRREGLPPPALVDGLSATVVTHLFNKLTSTSSRYEELFPRRKTDDSAKPSTPLKRRKTPVSAKRRKNDVSAKSNTSLKVKVPVPIVMNDASDQEKPNELPFHIDIDLKTCRPSEICRITKRPAKECAPPGTFDVRSGSYAKVFHLYCSKKNKYPENSSQLVILHNRRRAKDNISPRHIEKYMDHIFKIHEDVMKKYSCAEYLKIYDPGRKALTTPSQQKDTLSTSSI